MWRWIRDNSGFEKLPQGGSPRDVLGAQQSQDHDPAGPGREGEYREREIFKYGS